jgi:two-component system, OmpR family, phosphate regulon sensor histidine kinase PhoR
MKKRRYGILVILFSMAVIGLLWTQYYWINSSYMLKSDELATKANTALKAVATQIEKSYYCIDFFADFQVYKGDRLFVLKDKFGIDPARNAPDTMPTFFWYGKNYDTLQAYNTIVLPMPAKVQLKLSIQYQMNSQLVSEKNAPDTQKLTLNSYRNSIDDDPDFLQTFDSLLNIELAKNNLNFKYNYAITSSSTDSVIYSNTSNDYVFKSAISTTIFSDNYFYNPLTIYLEFPEKDVDMIKELWGVAVISILILLVIILLILYIFRTIISERNLSEMKLDFIGNMTHEFRTPVANINLALDTLNKQTQSIPEKSKYIINILHEENVRMQNNIESILESGFLEKKEFDLRKEPVNIKEVLVRVVKSFELEIDEKKGALDCHVEKEEVICFIDETHMLNALSNIIDNAIQYCESPPMINVESKLISKYYRIRIKDNGIGIPKDAIKKIFDKFYRVPKGNLHNTKGFGLGLSYSKKIIEAHGGEIKVESKEGRGSTFEILLPLN